MRYMKLASLAIGLLLLNKVSLVLAQPQSGDYYPPTPTRYIKPTIAALPTDKKKDLPKSGALSTSVSGGANTDGVALPWGGVDSAGKDAAPITGSVSAISEREWVVKLFNNAEERFSVSVKVGQYNERGTQVRSDSFSYTLKPRGAAERNFPRAAGATVARLNLENWKSLDTKKTK